MPRTRTGVNQPLIKRLMPLAWGLMALVTLLVLFTWGALQIQVALAGFLNGESIWSKAQKQAVINLDNYASTGVPRYLAAYRKDYLILMNDRRARDEVTRVHYDYGQVARTLAADNAMHKSIPVIIFMMRYLNQAPYMKESLQAWRSVDGQIDQLGQIADQLQAAYAKGSADPEWIRQQRQRIYALNSYIEPRSNRFSNMMARGALWVSHALFVGMLTVSIIALMLWLWMARRTLAGIRGSEERYRLLFDSAADAIVMVDDASGRILQVNRKALDWTGQKNANVKGHPFDELFEHQKVKTGDDRKVSMLRNRQGRSRPVEMLSSLVHWGDQRVRQAILRDVTERLELEHERRIAAKALASVAEGVIITDTERRIRTVNVALERLTGFSSAELKHTRLEEHRRMPDGQPLPESIWDIVAREGHWSGEVQGLRRDGSVYPELLSISVIRDVEGHIEQYVAVCTDITDNKAGQRHLQYLATHDALTGLVNRSEFELQVTHAISAAERAHATLAVLFIDLDNFKLINVSYSHAIGDKLLSAVAERIHQQLPENASAGRIGGDEFTVLLRQFQAREDLTGLAERLLEAISQPLMIDAYEVKLGASIGIAAFPLDGQTATSLITNADAAMYSVKLDERNAYRFYTPRLRSDANRRLLLLTDLRSALEGDQFELLFQPCLKLDDRSLAGAEALIRWQHPERGLIMPSEFIPLAETLGLIRHIDEWVLKRVCRQISIWNEKCLSSARIAANISANWFAHEGFIDQLTSVIQDSGIEPGQIMLEVTESTILNLGETTRTTMKALHALGVEVAIDDFGTGYSSLSYLKLPAVTYLKIDRIFVDGLPESLEDASIVQAMLVMSHSLGLKVIAEGIETVEQHDFLKMAGCPEGQGYLYSRPITSLAFEAMLQQHGQLALPVPDGRDSDSS